MFGFAFARATPHVHNLPERPRPLR